MSNHNLFIHGALDDEGRQKTVMQNLTDLALNMALALALPFDMPSPWGFFLIRPLNNPPPPGILGTAEPLF